MSTPRALFLQLTQFRIAESGENKESLSPEQSGFTSGGLDGHLGAGILQLLLETICF